MLGIDFMSFLMGLIVFWNGLAGQGCKYDLSTASWNCPKPTDTSAPVIIRTVQARRN